MFKGIIGFLVLLVILSMCVHDEAFAIGAGGFRNEVVSARGMGRGSANVAQIDDPAAVQYNPAAITYLEKGAVTLGYAMEMPRAICTTNAGVETNMQAQDFLIPNFYLVNNFGSEKFSFGLGVTAPYGLGTDWADDSFSKYVSTESNMEFSSLNPTVAYRVNDALSLGAGIDIMSSKINKNRKTNVTRINTLLGVPAVEADGNFQLKEEDDETWGYNLGLLYKPQEKHTFGLSYRSEVDFEYAGSLAMNNLGAGATAGTFGQTYSTSIKSDLTLPQSIAAGYGYKVSDKLNFEFDVEWTDWSTVEQDYIKWQQETNTTRLSVLNADNPSGKDWESVFSFAFGFDYKLSDKTNLRCGYLFEETPVPDSSFDSALPDADRHGLSLGFGYKFKDVTIDASYLGLLFVDRSIDNDVGSGAGANLDEKYEQYINIFAVGFTYEY